MPQAHHSMELGSFFSQGLLGSHQIPFGIQDETPVILPSDEEDTLIPQLEDLLDDLDASWRYPEAELRKVLVPQAAAHTGFFEAFQTLKYWN